MRKIYYNNLLARLLLWRKDYETAMIFGFICTKRKQAQPLSSKAVNHEAIHVEQYMEVTAVALLAALMLSLASVGRLAIRRGAPALLHHLFC